MKNIFKTIMILTVIMSLLVSCAPNGAGVKSTEIATKFYTEYLNAKDLESAEKVKKTYMTPVMIEELDLRAKQMEADSITGVQDSFGMIDKMAVTEGENDDTAVVTFDMIEKEGVPYNIYEVKLHFRKEKGKKFIDTLDMIIYDVDADGDKTQTEHFTKYANKDVLSDEDKAAMERIRKYYDDLAEEGFIG